MSGSHALFPDGERRLRFRRRVKVLGDDEAGDAAEHDDEGEREQDLVPDVCARVGRGTGGQVARVEDRENRGGGEESRGRPESRVRPRPGPAYALYGAGLAMPDACACARVEVCARET